MHYLSLSTLADIASSIMAIVALAVMLVKPIRNKVFGIRKMEEGQKCILRSEILKLYYRNKADKRLKQFERENIEYLYKAYKSMGGNSFVDDIYSEIRKWDITP